MLEKIKILAIKRPNCTVETEMVTMRIMKLVIVTVTVLLGRSDVCVDSNGELGRIIWGEAKQS